MPEQSEHSFETLMASIWSRREAGIRLPTDVNLTRPITREDMEYLYNNNYPYLQIMNSQADFSQEVFPRFVELPNGWVLIDYENAMCSSYSTKHCFKQSEAETIPLSSIATNFAGEDIIENAEDSDEDEDGGSSGGGTIIKQQFDTVLSMIKEVKNRGWDAVEVVAGTNLMQFYAWAAAKELGVTLYGYTPTAEQERHFKVIEREKLISKEKRKKRAEVLSPE